MKANCPHCSAERIKHPNGWLHCNECGCCFEGDELRDGHPPCKGSLPEMAAPEEKVEEAPVEEEPEEELEVIEEDEAPKPRRTRKP